MRIPVLLHIDHAEQIVRLVRLRFVDGNLLKGNRVTEKGARFHSRDLSPAMSCASKSISCSRRLSISRLYSAKSANQIGDPRENLRFGKEEGACGSEAFPALRETGEGERSRLLLTCERYETQLSPRKR